MAYTTVFHVFWRVVVTLICFGLKHSVAQWAGLLICHISITVVKWKGVGWLNSMIHVCQSVLPSHPGCLITSAFILRLKARTVVRSGSFIESAMKTSQVSYGLFLIIKIRYWYKLILSCWFVVDIRFQSRKWNSSLFLVANQVNCCRDVEVFWFSLDAIYQ